MTALEPFPTVRHPRVHRPVIGSALSLRCRPPRSYPTPTIFWGGEDAAGGLQQIDTNDRITLDYLGNPNVIWEEPRRHATRPSHQKPFSWGMWTTSNT